ncbi:MAG: DedA family protein [Opitutales bacterium]|nr:DedA family protein [Opitutales bacterium]
MAALVAWLLTHINYWTVAIFMAVESSFVPFPSEVVVPPGAYKAAAGELSLIWVVIVATVGADLGALFNYYIARYFGRDFVYRFAQSKLGRLCLLNEEKIARAELFFRKYGAVATMTGRLVPVVRQFISIPAGLSKMPVGKFLIYTTLGAGAWNIVLAVIGYALHSVVAYEDLVPMVESYSKPIGLAIALVAALALLVVFLKKRFEIQK